MTKARVYISERPVMHRLDEKHRKFYITTGGLHDARDPGARPKVKGLANILQSHINDKREEKQSGIRDIILNKTPQSNPKRVITALRIK